MLTGRHLIAGTWIAGSQKFVSEPAEGSAHTFSLGTPDHVDEAVKAAESAFSTYSLTSRSERAAFLRTIAEEIEIRGPEITTVGSQETGLPPARMESERGRTCGQLRLFADHIETGEYLDRRYDAALPDRMPMARPDLRVMQQPIGPVAVFGASNFPLAFSVAGGDTASALAAGCPVVVKGHSAHPGTGEIVAQAVLAAIETHGFDPGVFSLVQGGTRETGQTLVMHELIRAVGFTGSLTGGRALFDLCAARPEPIPFFGELGSVNPVFLLPSALGSRGKKIAEDWVGSLTLGAGQFCTNPGIVVAIDGPELDDFVDIAKSMLSGVEAQTMLTDGIAQAYREGRDRVAAAEGVRHLVSTNCNLRSASPDLFKVSGADWLANADLAEEVFGPLGLVVAVKDARELTEVTQSFEGQLTFTLQLDDPDHQLAHSLLPVMQRKAGRVLANGFPTGVEVCDAMVHGGPYPASTNFGATSVGTLAIRRWLRPVCYQNMPIDLLPADLS